MNIRTEGYDHDDRPFETKREEWYHKRPPKWLLAPLLLVLVGATAAAWAERHDDWNGASGYNDRLPRAAVAYQGQVWVPEGSPVILPDRRMVQVGETVEDLNLYTVSVPVGGGGGAAARPLVSTEQVFLRVGADQYQPVTLRRVGTNVSPIGPEQLDDHD